MIGIFDSGVGGMCALRQVRGMLPRADILYLADRKNSPYGTKGAQEILRLTKNNIKRLRDMGAEAILIACCTASSLYPYLSPEERAISTPIIEAGAMRAVEVGSRITVIATEHTARSRAFSREIARHCDAHVSELAEQELVSLVEGGCRDGAVGPREREYLFGLRDRILSTGADTLILGCTHFSHLYGEISAMLPGIKIISPAKEGAIQIVKKISRRPTGCGRTVYTS